MRIAVISDLHLKAKTGSSDFFLKDEEFYLFLKEIISEIDMLVINGDLYELWQGDYPTSKNIEEEYSNAVNEYRKSIWLINTNDKIKLCYGNHDIFLENIKFKDGKIYHNFEYDGVYIEHGVTDFFNKHFPLLVRYLAWFSGKLEVMFGQNIDNTLDAFARKYGLNFINNGSQIIHSKKIFRENDSLEIIVNGHTHHKSVTGFYIKDKFKIHVNTGSFNGKSRDITIIDTDTNHIIQNDYNYDFKIKDVRNSLQKGDFILSMNTTSYGSKAITTITKSDYSHVMIYLGNGRILESSTSGKKGVKVVSIDRYFDGFHNLAILRMTDQSKINSIIKNLRKRIGNKYAFTQIFQGLFVKACSFIYGKDLRKDLSYDVSYNKEVCSELMAYAILEETGMSIAEGVPPSNTEPADFWKNKKIFHKIIKYVVANNGKSIRSSK